MQTYTTQLNFIEQLIETAFYQKQVCIVCKEKNDFTTVCQINAIKNVIRQRIMIIALNHKNSLGPKAMFIYQKPDVKTEH